MEQHANADRLSRIPLGTCQAASVDSMAAFMIGQIQVLPVTAKQVQTTTRQDQILSQVFRYVQTGWPQHVDKLTNLLLIVNKNYPLRRDVYFGETEPTKLRSCLVKELHRGHPGASRMKL